MDKNPTNLEKKRHSLAHLLAAAVRELYPKAKPTIGPATDTGFYYDFDFGDTTVGDKELAKIEKVMRKILPTWDSFEGEKVDQANAQARFEGNEYKLELIDDISATKEDITLYTSGTFTDLCRGGHVEDAREIKADSFKLDRVAGAYWRGDENNTMLTRIYGLAFDTKEELETYITQQEQAKERDHRKIGKELDLFTFSDLIGAGLPLFTPKGRSLRDAITNRIESIQKKYGYKNVWIPHITKPDLYKTSGHWDKFDDELFHVRGKNDAEFVMKPMNCPHHTQIFASSPKSYRDLPLRFSEATTVYRDEQAGELIGLSRVRSLTQDDGHAFCTPEQITQEITNVIEIITEFYTALGMFTEGGYRLTVSVRDPETPEKYLGEDSVWDEAEATLKQVAADKGFTFEVEEGEAAFYGPKLDFKFNDALGREWQLATIQLDFSMPKRFELEYTDQDGIKKTPVMIHRAIAGSIERFMAIMIEHFAGNFPLWLSPTQVKILPIGDDHIDFAKEIEQQLTGKDYRVEVDLSNNGFGKKVRNAKVEKVPYFIIIGDKELEEKKVTLESRDNGNLGMIAPEEIIDTLK